MSHFGASRALGNRDRTDACKAEHLARLMAVDQFVGAGVGETGDFLDRDEWARRPIVAKAPR